MVENLCSSYSEVIAIVDEKYYAFPNIDHLAAAKDIEGRVVKTLEIVALILAWKSENFRELASKDSLGLVRGLTPGRAWMESNFHFSRIAIFTLGACLNTISKPLGSNFAILTPEGRQAPLRWLGYTI